MRLLIVIPARLGSSRIPEKPLCLLNGEPLVRLVVRRALELELDGQILVATDDMRVAEAVAEVGVTSVITSPTCRSGTERVAEVLSLPEYGSAEVVLNLQCDQPFLPVEAALGALQQVRAGFAIGTAASRLTADDRQDPNRVKVVSDGTGRALAFSRHPIGPVRAGASQRPVGRAGVYHHIGVYAYARESLFRWMELPPTVEEQTERLEQLRPLVHDLSIGVAVLNRTVDAGIDSLEDLERAQMMIDSSVYQVRT